MVALHAYACIYIIMQACIHNHACIDKYVSMHACMNACMHTCMHACSCMDAWMHGCMDAWMHRCMHAWGTGWSEHRSKVGGSPLSMAMDLPNFLPNCRCQPMLGNALRQKVECVVFVARFWVKVGWSFSRKCDVTVVAVGRNGLILTQDGATQHTKP